VDKELLVYLNLYKGCEEMGYQNILFSMEAGIATITLNRPKEMNSLNLEIIEDLNNAMDECANNKDIRVVVVTGNGKVFSAGDDIKIMDMVTGKSEQEVADIIEKEGYPSLIKKIMSLKKPVIASINGICYGAAGELALACDYIIASDKASFGQLYIKLGLIGNTYLLPRYVGVKKALDLIWTGKIIEANEALQLGMVNEVVAAESLQEAVQKKAKKLSKGPTVAYGLAKKAIYESISLNLEEGLKLMTTSQGILMKTKDHKEGVAAFLERRKAVYSGE
jgi:enoyl-CoA hydratase/carnithine racemase